MANFTSLNGISCDSVSSANGVAKASVNNINGIESCSGHDPGPAMSRLLIGYDDAHVGYVDIDNITTKTPYEL